MVERALMDEVVERGFRGATIAGVCDRAGLEPEGYRRHFGESTWRDQIRAVAYAVHEFVDEDRRRGAFLWIETFNAGERAQVIREGAVDAMIDLIDQGRRQLDDPDQLTRATAEAIGGSMFRQTPLAIECDGPNTVDLLPKLMYAVVFPYLGADAALEELSIKPGEREARAG